LTIANSIAPNIDRVVMAVNLGCGSWGDNSISVNVTLHHLLNIKTLAEGRENMLWFRIPGKIYFKSGCLPVALRDLAGKKRASIVTDKPLFELGLIEEVTDSLEEIGIDRYTFYDVAPDPSLATVGKV
jgi:acetaldehyde dehydrogenase/alcohol dehydrogenase